MSSTIQSGASEGKAIAMSNVSNISPTEKRSQSGFMVATR
jgi:hypothetical protein